MTRQLGLAGDPAQLVLMNWPSAASWPARIASFPSASFCSTQASYRRVEGSASMLLIVRILPTRLRDGPVPLIWNALRWALPLSIPQAFRDRHR